MAAVTTENNLNLGWVGEHQVRRGDDCNWICVRCGMDNPFLDPFRTITCGRYQTKEQVDWDWTKVRGSSSDFDCAQEETRIHSGPAKYLCNVGAGCVCDEPPSRFEELLEQMRELHRKKRSDYTGISGDILRNYRTSSQLAGITMEQGMFARLCEKIVRISSVMSKGGDTQVTDEKLLDTYFDIAVMSLLSIIAHEETK